METFALDGVCLAEDLRFCSDCLREVTVNRCEALRTLILDAPYLMNLRVDHCFNLDTIEFLHPSPTGGPLKVSSRGAYLGGTARRNLRAHPRSVRADDDQDAARSVFPLASYAHEDHSGQAARALNGRSSGCKAWWDSSVGRRVGLVVVYCAIVMTSSNKEGREAPCATFGDLGGPPGTGSASRTARRRRRGPNSFFSVF